MNNELFRYLKGNLSASCRSKTIVCRDIKSYFDIVIR